MRKKILSVLLSVCMVLTLMPTVAFAADESATTTVDGNGIAIEGANTSIKPANLSGNGMVGNPLYIANSYKLTKAGSNKTSRTGSDEITWQSYDLAVQGLKAHPMGEQPHLFNYWCGISAWYTGTEGGVTVTGMKWGSGTTPEAALEKFNAASVTGLWENVKGETDGLSMYRNPIAEGGYYVVLQWYKGEDPNKTAVNETPIYIYYSTSGCQKDTSHVAEGAVKEAILHDTTETGAIADTDLIQDYTVLASEEIYAGDGGDNIQNGYDKTAGYQVNIKISGTDLRKHRNANTPAADGYWIGAAIKKPTGANSFKYAKADTKAELLTADMGSAVTQFDAAKGDAEQNYVAYYFDAEKSKTEVNKNKKWFKIAWYSDAGANTIIDTTIYCFDVADVTLYNENNKIESVSVLDGAAESGITATAAVDENAEGEKTGKITFSTANPIDKPEVDKTFNVKCTMTNGAEQTATLKYTAESGEWSLDPATIIVSGSDIVYTPEFNIEFKPAEPALSTTITAITVETKDETDKVSSITATASAITVEGNEVPAIKLTGIIKDPGTGEGQDYTIKYKTNTNPTEVIVTIKLKKGDDSKVTVAPSTINVAGLETVSLDVTGVSILKVEDPKPVENVTAPSNVSNKNAADAAASAINSSDSAAKANVIVPPTDETKAAEYEEAIHDAINSDKLDPDYVKQQLTAEGEEPPESYEIKVETSIDIAVKDAVASDASASNITEITFAIALNYEVKATVGDKAVTLDSGKVENPPALTINIPLPAAFTNNITAVNGVKKAYVKHKGNVYVGTITNGILNFENPDGFSDFTVLAENPIKATIGTKNYDSLQAAVNSIPANTPETITIIVLDGDQKATVNVPKNIKLEAGKGVTITDDMLTAGDFVTINRKPDGTIEFKYNGKNKSDAVAEIGNISFLTLQKAVDAVVDGQTIVLKNNDTAGATVSREVSFTIDKAGYKHGAIKAGNGFTNLGQGDEYNFKSESKVINPPTPTGPTGGGGGGAATYTVSAPSSVDNGKITVSPRNASKGNTVTITATPDEGYKVGTITVKDKDGKEIEVKDAGNNKYTFVMPASKVDISATFVEDDGKEPTEPTDPTTPSAVTYSDVASTAWYYGAVNYVTTNGLMNGVGNDRFAPNSNLTRAMFAQILYNKEGKPAAGASTFSDVAAGQWYTDAISWAAANGVVNGIGNNMFGPNNNITREQLAVMLYRYAGSPAVTGSVTGFNDASQISSYATTAMAWATTNGVMNGKGDGRLDPKGLATRAEVAQMMQNYFK